MRTEFIDYRVDDFVMEGFLAVAESTSAAQPLILIIHDWTSNCEFSQEKAKYFAKQGFAAFAVDLYGKGKRGKFGDRALNQSLLTPILKDRSVIVPRLNAALECAQRMVSINNKKIMT